MHKFNSTAVENSMEFSNQNLAEWNVYLHREVIINFKRK